MVTDASLLTASSGSKPPLTPLTGSVRAMTTGSPLPSALKPLVSSLSPKSGVHPGSSPIGTAAGGSPKSVSFADSPKTQPGDQNTHTHPSAAAGGGASPYALDSVVSNVDFWDDQSDGHSMSGYSAYSGGGRHTETTQRGRQPPSSSVRFSKAAPMSTATSATPKNSYRARLERFYQQYNPEKLSRVDEFLAAYKGDEEVLFKVLVGKYGPEPLFSSPTSPTSSHGLVGLRLAEDLQDSGDVMYVDDVDSNDGGGSTCASSIDPRQPHHRDLEDYEAMPSSRGPPAVPTTPTGMEGIVAMAGSPLAAGGGSRCAMGGGRGSLQDTRSECGSVMHYTGQRWELPKIVSAVDGRTDVATPYWPGNRAICDTDVLSLLRLLRTDNEELSRCYIGMLAQHPTSSFNGLVYVTKAPFPASNASKSTSSHVGADAGPEGDDAVSSPVVGCDGIEPTTRMDSVVSPSAPSEPFLDHQWAGRLANNKSLVHQNATFSRTVLHCTEACQAGNVRLPSHERWRLTVYWWDGSPLALYRVMWDPIIATQPLPPSDALSDTASSVSSSSHSKGYTITGQPSHLQSRSGTSGSSGHHRRAEQPVQPPPASLSGRPSFSADSAQLSMPTTSFHSALDALESKVREMLVVFGRRVEERFVAVEKRLERLENAATMKSQIR